MGHQAHAPRQLLRRGGGEGVRDERTAQRVLDAPHTRIAPGDLAERGAGRGGAGRSVGCGSGARRGGGWGGDADTWCNLAGLLEFSLNDPAAAAAAYRQV